MGVAFRAVFPTKKQFTATPAGPVKGVIVAQSGQGGTGVMYSIRIENLPDEGGPFGKSTKVTTLSWLLGTENREYVAHDGFVVYHIHESAVPSDGNCTATDGHLDPFERGEEPSCDPDLPQTCQVGDLAGKHGAIVTTQGSTTFSESYTDDFCAVS